MSVNRIEKFLSKEALTSGFINASPAGSNLESLFEGLTLDMLIKEELEKARQEGYTQAIEDFIKVVQVRIEEHVRNLINAGLAVRNITSQSLPESNIKQIRAKYSSEPNCLDMFFVIEIKKEDELLFAKLLDRFENFLLNEKKIVAELNFLNEKDRQIDYGMLKGNYPFSLNLNYIVNASQRSSHSTSKA